MKQGIFEIIENVRLTDNVYKARLSGDVSEIIAPGQFVNVLIDGLYLRRPISVCDKDETSLTIIYKTVGKGTEKMSEMAKGDKLDLLTGLGKWLRPLFVGG